MYKLNRAQTATEYLVILAIVIVISLIVVGVLGGIPGIGGGTGDNVGSLYFSTAPVGIKDASFSASGADSITVTNNNAFDIELVNLTITDSALATTVVVLRSNHTNVTISAGGEYQVVGGTSLNSYAITSDFITCNTGGDSYTEDVVVNYKNKRTGAIFSTDYDRSIQGICAN